jgi:RNA polymerase sigma-70 factor (ECF subfamily)
MTDRDASDALSAAATRTLLERRGVFLAFLRRKVGSQELAEDILQGAYAKALELGGQLRDDETAVAWFFRILRTSIADRARRDAAAARSLERLAREVDGEGDHEDVERIVCGCVTAVLDTLKPEYQAPVRAIDVEGQALRSFAEQAGITPSNAAVRLHRARGALARGLRSTCGACATQGCLDCTCGISDRPASSPSTRIRQL